MVASISLFCVWSVLSLTIPQYTQEIVIWSLIQLNYLTIIILEGTIVLKALWLPGAATFTLNAHWRMGMILVKEVNV